MMSFAGLKDFLLIWAGQLTSAIGSRLSSFALGIWVLQTTGSLTQFGLIYIAMDLPALAAAPVAGALVDRWDRRKIMIACDALSATAMLGLAVLLGTGHLVIWHIYVVVGLMAIATTFHAPAFQASIPLLVKGQDLERINGMVQSGRAAASIVGPLIAGALVTAINLYGVLIIDGLSFIAAVLGLLWASVPRPTRSEHHEESGLMQEAVIGWRYVHQRPGLMGLVFIDAFTGFVFSLASVLISPLVLSFQSPTMVGIQYSLSGVGLLVGGLALTAFGAPSKRMNAIVGLTLLGGFCMALHGVYPSFALIAGSGLILFMTLPVVAALNTALWQTKVPADLQGRCFAIQQVMTNFVSPAGYFLAGALSEHFFEPLLKTDGALASTVGQVIGVGAGRGIALMFVILGVMMMLAAVGAYCVRAVREVDQLPDIANEHPVAADRDVSVVGAHA